MLSKRIELTIKDYTATLSSEIKFYKNDCLDLIFGIKEYGVKVRNGIAEANLMPINALNAKLLIETPSGVDSIEATSIEGNEITFRLTNSITRYIGKGKMQIRLYDEDGCEEIIIRKFPNGARAVYNIQENILGIITADDTIINIDEDDDFEYIVQFI